MSIAVYESRKSDRIVKFISKSELQKKFHDMEYLTLYYNKKGRIVGYRWDYAGSKSFEVLRDPSLIACYKIDENYNIRQSLKNEDDDGWFDDNGGTPNGNTLLIPCDKLINELFEYEEIFYCEEYPNWDGNDEAFDGKEWCGWTTRDYALVVVE